MRFTVLADLHLRGKNPRMRNDNYVDAQFKKLAFAVEEAQGGFLLLAGDIFDRHDVSLNIIRRTIETLEPLQGKCLFVRGNHDTAYHSKNVEGSPLGILQASGVGRYIPDGEYHTIDGDVKICGLGWGGEPAKPKEGFLNILLSHFSVYENKPPFYMPDALSVNDFEAKFPGFDFYIAGDIHETCQKSKTLVPGSLMRMAASQQDFKPRVWVLDTDSRSFSYKLIPVESNVFDLEAIQESENKKEAAKEADHKLQEMVLKMEDKSDVVNFDAILKEVMGPTTESIKQIIREVMV